MKKENIKKNAAIITIVSSLIVAGTGILVEELTDHANEYCPYCGILGIQHQVDVVNNSKKNMYEGYTAKLAYDYDATFVTSAPMVINKDGKYDYYVPNGFTLTDEYEEIKGLHGTFRIRKAKKDVHFDECILVTNEENGKTKIISR